MANQKLTEDQVQRINDTQQRRQAVIQELGNLDIDRATLEAKRNQVLAFLDETLELEKALGEELTEAYGPGTVDLEAEEFIPAEEK